MVHKIFGAVCTLIVADAPLFIGEVRDVTCIPLGCCCGEVVSVVVVSIVVVVSATLVVVVACTVVVVSSFFVVVVVSKTVFSVLVVVSILDGAVIPGIVVSIVELSCISVLVPILEVTLFEHEIKLKDNKKINTSRIVNILFLIFILSFQGKQIIIKNIKENNVLSFLLGIIIVNIQ